MDDKTSPMTTGSAASSPPPADEFVALLEETFFANADKSATERREALGRAIGRATADLDAEQAARLIEATKARLAAGGAEPPPEDTGDEEREKLQQENAALRARVAELEQSSGLGDDAQRALSELSRNLLGIDSPFTTPEEVVRFCNRIRESITLFLNTYKKLLAGRKKFQLEYAMFFGMSQSMEGTRIWRTMDQQKLCEIFLRWDKTTEIEDTAEQLRGALNELYYHQLAFLRGYRESVKKGTLEIVYDVSPAAIEKDLAAKKIALGPIKIPFSAWPFKAGIILNEVRRRMDDLVQEDVRYFEDKFRDAFTAGYREMIKVLHEERVEGEGE